MLKLDGPAMSDRTWMRGAIARKKETSREATGIDQGLALVSEVRIGKLKHLIAQKIQLTRASTN